MHDNDANTAVQIALEIHSCDLTSVQEITDRIAHALAAVRTEGDLKIAYLEGLARGTGLEIKYPKPPEDTHVG